MGILPTTTQNHVLDAVLGTATLTAPVTGIKTRLDSTAPTASASGTEITSGGGYTTGGTVTTWNAASGGATTNITSLTWVNSSGGAWTLVGIELNDFSANRFLYGTWTGQPITVSNGNTFAVAAGAIAVSGSAW